MVKSIRCLFGGVTGLLLLQGTHAIGLQDVTAAESTASAPIVNLGCPTRCVDAGPVSGNWSIYRSFDQLTHCPQTLFHDFSLHDPVDDANQIHHIAACTNYGADWTHAATGSDSTAHTTVDQLNATVEIGNWNGKDHVSRADLGLIIKQFRSYTDNGHGVADKPVQLYARSSGTSAGLFIGPGLNSKELGNLLRRLEGAVYRQKDASSFVFQLCDDKFKGTHAFGLVAHGNGTFGTIQDAIKTWRDGKCFDLNEPKKIPAAVSVSKPFLQRSSNSTASNSTSSSSNMVRRLLSKLPLTKRGQCRTETVELGQGCPEMADKCGISPHEFDRINSKPRFCSSLRPHQLVCCSEGDLPDVRPKMNADGSCYAHIVKAGEGCSDLALTNGLTEKDILDFNKNTWGWTGCDLIWKDIHICLSPGRPPIPAPVANALCGPQVPGTVDPGDGSDPAGWNPCPLKACCDIWGQCGTTTEFCTDTNTGAPGTARPGTNGCISNCATGIQHSGRPAVFRKIGYFEGFNLHRKCLFQDASQIDASQYTHLHFAFGMITHDFEINTGDDLTTFEFNQFKAVQGPKRIISFGGWEFSTGPDTYTIFRDGVRGGNRHKLSQNIANFVNAHGLDGVDIDWEYPGATDIPGTPPASADDGINYLRFIITLKELMPDKSVSIAAPASYWYLRNFPIEEMAQHLDYIIYMTYDLHGQWDAGNKWSQEGCPSGQCLRSGVNLTETMGALSMITRAGVPSNKVVVGVTSYGRSHGMADGNCHTPNCFFTGTRFDSTAKKGVCTDTAGYISNAEIKDILRDSGRIKQNYIDEVSNSNILVYDDNQWIGWMSPDIRNHRAEIYANEEMGGTTNWAIDLEDYYSRPNTDTNHARHPDGGIFFEQWNDFKKTVVSGGDPNHQLPRTDGERHGQWSKMDCSYDGVVAGQRWTPKHRWESLDVSTAWDDLVDNWRKNHLQDESFMTNLMHATHGPEHFNCDNLVNDEACHSDKVCTEFVGEGTGPAAYMIANSLIRIHGRYLEIRAAIIDARNDISDHLDSYLDRFAPLPSTDDPLWLKILMDVATLGVTMVFNGFMGNFIKELPHFLEHPKQYDVVKDLTGGMLSNGINAAKNAREEAKKKGIWDASQQHDFKAWIGELETQLLNFNDEAAKGLFSGDDNSIKTLGALIADGKLIDGVEDENAAHKKLVSFNFANRKVVTENLRTTIFGLSIPILWFTSGKRPFVMDSGVGCDKIGQLEDYEYYMTGDMQRDGGICIDGRAYFLVTTADNESGLLSVPTGDDWIGSNEYGRRFDLLAGTKDLRKDGGYFGVKFDDMVKGSLAVFRANGNKNVGYRETTADGPELLRDAEGLDLSIPGFYRLPVCSYTEAHKNWNDDNRNVNSKNYPCDG